MPKDCYYFSHDNNARNDEKILCLMAEYGIEGYGIYWVIVEMMHEAENTELRHDTLNGIAFRFSLPITTLQGALSLAITLKLFESDGVVFWSNSLRSRKATWKEKHNKLSESGKAGMAKRWGKNNEDITSLLPPNNNKRKGKERKGNKKKEKDTLLSGFFSFWNAYPKKISKEASEKAWLKLSPSEDLLETILDAVDLQTKSEDWKKENGKYIPFPATWLNGKRWDDEVILTNEAGKRIYPLIDDFYTLPEDVQIKNREAVSARPQKEQAQLCLLLQQQAIEDSNAE